MSLVLVADDEPAVLEVLSEVVADLGHEVVRAHDGSQALELARSQTPTLLVTDQVMPGLSGLELCRAFAEDARLREVPVILLSAANVGEVPVGHAFLPKPFELSEFEQLVRETLIACGAQSEALSGSSHHTRGRNSSEWAKWMLHEIKTPLSAAKMHLSALERALPGTVEEEHLVHLRALARSLEKIESEVRTAFASSRA